MVTKDKQVVTFSSTDGTLSVVICMDELDVKQLDEKMATQGTHFVEGWSTRIFVRTNVGGCLVVIPQ